LCFSILLVLTALPGCGAGEELASTVTGTIEVITDTSEPDLAPDALTFTIEGTSPIEIGPVDTVQRPGLEPGSYTVSVGEVGEACLIAGSSSRITSVSPGAVSRIVFVVNCVGPQPAGAIEVEVVTTGVELDADGYTIVAGEGPQVAIGINGVDSIGNVPPGDVPVRLDGVAGNCVVQDEPSRTVIVTSSEISTATFEVVCWPRASGRIAYVRVRAGDVRVGDVYIRNADGTGSLNVTDSFEAEQEVTWSPDGTRLAFSRINEGAGAFDQVFIVSAAGGTPVRLLPAAINAEQPKWSNDGEHILFRELGVLATVRPNGSDLRRLTHDTFSVFSASWSPDDDRIAFVSGSELFIIGSSGGEPVNITADTDLESVGDVAWSPTDDRIALVGTRRGGSFFTDRIYTIRSDGTELTALTDSAADYEAPTWSPDGTKLAFILGNVPVNLPEASETDMVYIMNADGSGMRPFSAMNEEAQAPSWGPE
jgi:hypothetical protein